MHKGVKCFSGLSVTIWQDRRYNTFTRLALDPSAMVKPTVADECGHTQVELYTREYTHEIHKKESPNIF